MSKIQSFIFKHSIFIGTIKTGVMNIEGRDLLRKDLSTSMNTFEEKKRMKKKKDMTLSYLQETMVNTIY